MQPRKTSAEAPPQAPLHAPGGTGSDAFSTTPLPCSSSSHMASVLGLLAGMLVATAPLVAPTASAVAGPPFDTSRPTVFVAQSTLANDPTTLYRTETQGDGTYVFTPEGSAAPGRYNAIGFNDAR